MATRVVVLALFLGFINPPVFGLPDWIWIDSPATAEGVVFYHDFDADPARLQSAHLRLVTDFTSVKLTINGQQAGIAEAFEPVLIEGKAIQIHAQDVQSPQPVMMMARSKESGNADSYRPGETDITARVQITFELD